ncbi:hypothetical protein FKM82_004386 [Ascaphus truei]
MAAGGSGTRKHKWTNLAEVSPNKYLRCNDTKLPRRVSDTGSRESESMCVAQERRVTFSPCQAAAQGRAIPARAGDHPAGYVRRRGSFKGYLPRSSSPLHKTVQLEKSADLVTRHSEPLISEGNYGPEQSTEDTGHVQKDAPSCPKNRTPRAHPPSVLFMKAFRDIIGGPVRTKRSSSNEPATPEPDPSAGSARLSQEESTSATSRAADAFNAETHSDRFLKKEKYDTSERPPDRSRTDSQPKPGPEVQEERLVFLYDNDTDEDIGSGLVLEKDPSIGSDFSDVEDVDSLARFSQEEPAVSCCPEPEDFSETPSSYVMYPEHLYRSPWCNYTEHWTSSQLYRPCAEQSAWRQEESNSSHVSEHSLNLVDNSVLNVSSNSDTTGDRQRVRFGSFDSSWFCEGTNKRTRQGSETRAPADPPGVPKFLQDGFIDTHCHLDMLFSRLSFNGSFASFRQKNPSTFPKEFQGCIADFCDPGTLGDLQWEHLLGEDMVWGAFGCHPHFAQYYTDLKEKEVLNALRHPKAVAYGEMGLDYSHKCSTTVPVQHKVFERQLQLAVSLGKPLVIHCRGADDDLFRIMKKLVPWDYKIHRHCFTGSYDIIEPFLKEFPNMAVGFTALLTYPSAVEAQEAMRQIPLERLVVETDAPFFLPKQVPKDLCKFCHPGLALHTVHEIAKQKRLPVTAVLAALRQNTEQLYGL